MVLPSAVPPKKSASAIEIFPTLSETTSCTLMKTLKAMFPVDSDSDHLGL